MPLTLLQKISATAQALQDLLALTGQVQAALSNLSSFLDTV